METDILKSIWKDVDYDRESLSKEALNEILSKKVRNTKRRFFVVIGISAAVSIVVLTLVLMVSVKRRVDVFYLINNALLATITLTSLFSAVYSWYRLQKNDYALSLKDNLERDIEMISNSLNGRFRNIHLMVIPVIFILLVLSINVYFEERMFVEMFSTGSSIAALIAGVAVGLPVSFYVHRNIRNYQKRNLEELEALYEKTKG